MVGAYLLSGSALDSTFRNAQGTLVKQDSRDAQTLSARVRYQF